MAPMFKDRLFLAATLSLLVAMAQGCGDEADFGGPASARAGDDALGTGTDTGTDPGAGPVDPGPGEPPPDGGDPATPAPLAALTWYWECEATPGTAPAPASDKEAVVKGQGPHQFLPAELKGTPIVLSGKMCEPAALPRDIVFVVDVSGSMESENNDPRSGNTCGRLQAVESVIAAIPAGQARFGVVTFSSGLDRTSGALFPDQAQLYTSLGGAGGIADVLCDSGGGTNYDAGLLAASQVLQKGRTGATKEIYFISDGAPNTNQEGKQLAANLKTTGVNIGTGFVPATIATVMLRGNDQVMQQYIASKGPDGQPLHAYAAQTGQLTQLLTKLSSNEIVGAEMSWRAIGSAADWTKVNLLSHVSGFDFKLPSFSIEVDAAPEGIEVKYVYWDRHDNRFETGGRLAWKSTGGGG